jgi:hypothetical protein
VPLSGSLIQFLITPLTWKEQLAKAYTTVPATLKELAWKTSLLGFALSAALMGIALWKNPNVVLGTPTAEQSLIERLARNENIKEDVYELMDRFFYEYAPDGLMLVAWQELDSLTGIWVRPANRFPGKSGVHDLTEDMRVLAGPFIFGDCATTESMAMPDKVMVACPINSSYDVWGYVAAVVDEADVKNTLLVLNFLAHRITHLVY